MEGKNKAEKLYFSCEMKTDEGEINAKNTEQKKKKREQIDALYNTHNCIVKSHFSALKNLFYA